ncbi:glycosyl hydrolase [Colletotrichum costaricense]|uniref:Glycosyl hydrolase n=1 Tax=Colletotrichum costaricense TaxID=1209916 RepID=A0AAJ0DWV5_9PEZI|nr:glycosyl hydrolase [Colletotrichum costaricense]KAK1518937.1 glycosyl hydrolase [Colletotrichum costaricense]
MSPASKFLGLFSLVATAQAACSNFIIDDFSRSSVGGVNKLNSWTSDDGSMSKIAITNGALTFTPKADTTSYFYETLGCVKATTQGYKALSLSITGPKDASMLLEIQSRTSCSDNTYKSQWVTISGLTGSQQTVTISLSSFTEANLDAITGFVWSTYSQFSSNTNFKQLSVQPHSFGRYNSHFDIVYIRKCTSCKHGVEYCLLLFLDVSQAIRRLSECYLVRGKLPGQQYIFGSFKCSLIIPVHIFCQDVSYLQLRHFPVVTCFPSSDDGTMKSIAVSGNRVTLSPNNKDSYFYSKTACTNAKTQTYGGISLRIKATKGTTFQVQMASPAICGGDDTVFGFQSTADLGWTFDGTEKLYSFPFSKFPTIDQSKISSILFGSLSGAVTFGPMAFYCGSTPSEYIVKTQPSVSATASTVPAPSATVPAKVIDNFASQSQNALGFWHGGDVDTAAKWTKGKVVIKAPDADYSYYTQFGDGCTDMTMYDGSYLHVAYSGSNKFTIAMQQHNTQCSDTVAPFPETWDSLEAARYATGNDIYIPISHFNIVRKRAVGLAFKGFYTNEAVTLTKVEIVSSVPANTLIPNKLPSGNLVFACKRPNSIAFAIDDGDPKYAQEVMEVIRSENIKVTFFTVGAPLRDPSTNLSTIYQDMMKEGHQMALHSYTHPRMEGLPNNDAIMWEYSQDIAAVKEQFGITTKYFRPPFGNEGARMRQQLVAATQSNSPYIVNWNIDVEDWLYAQSDTPEQQKVSFKRDLDKGGSLVVMHYLYPSTVSYLRDFIKMAKATGKQLMRVDQCMEDPDAPPL